jgi:hypothetical protein
LRKPYVSSQQDIVERKALAQYRLDLAIGILA